MIKNAYIYTLEDDQSIKYIGLTDNPKRRLYQHRMWAKDGDSIKDKWIQDNAVLLKVLDTVPFEEGRFWEEHWVNLLRSWGFTLYNKTYCGYKYFDPQTLQTIKDKYKTYISNRFNPCKEVSKKGLFCFVCCIPDNALFEYKEGGCFESNLRLYKQNYCPKCGFIGKIYIYNTRNLFKCSSCKKQSQILCGTIFENSKLPLSKIGEIISFMNVSNLPATTHMAKYFKIQQGTAWRIRNILLEVTKQRLTDRILNDRQGDIVIYNTEINV